METGKKDVKKLLYHNINSLQFCYDEVLTCLEKIKEEENKEQHKRNMI